MSSASPTSLYHDFDALDIIALMMIEGFGPASTRAHLARIQHESRPIDDALPPGVFSAARADARDAVARGERIGALLHVDGSDDYPESLHALETPPVAIWTLGDISVVRERPCVSIVGTRDCTAYGERVTEKIASAFARAGATVISGMARGIDAIAHRATLDCGGKTVAVLGTGVDVPYPVGHRALHRHIIAAGLVLSEAPPGARAVQGCFPRRNRLIAALGSATIVVEAGVKSGALITADLAAAINRDVGAVPGPIDSPVSLGSNGLLRDGAQTITGVADALSLLKLSDGSRPAPPPEAPDERSIWDALRKPADSFDVLCARTSLPARICLETFTALELRGIVECTLTGELRRR